MRKRHAAREACQGLPLMPHLMESGWENFLKGLTSSPRRADQPHSAEQLAHLAFYAGAAILWGGIRGFSDDNRFHPEEGMQLTDQMLDEINQFLTANKVKLEWEPKVPRP